MWLLAYMYNYWVDRTDTGLYPWSHDQEKASHCQLDWMCAAHLEYKSLVLKNVKITGIWIRKNHCSVDKKQVPKN